MRWPSPSPSRYAKQKPDSIYQELSAAFKTLRQYAHDSKIDQHQQLLSNLLSVLMKRRNFVADAVFWTELYVQNTRHYPHLQQFCGVPFVNVTKHNHIVSFYMPLFASRPDLSHLPIVHLDSHDDLNPIADSGELPELFSKLKSSSDNKSSIENYISTVQALVWDIGAAISGILLTTGIRPYIWIMPEWLPDKDFVTTYGIYKSGEDLQLGHNVSTKAEIKKTENIPLKAYRNKTPSSTSIYAQIHDPKGEKSPKHALMNLLKDHDQFILDIDLDFFSCNGNPDLKRTDDDLASPHRIPYLEMTTEPRQVFSNNNKTYTSQMRLVQLELRHIDARLSRFKGMLTDLRNDGKKIAVISISDSTGVDFSECTDCASVTNQYVSSHMALYIRTKVMAIIQHVFTKQHK